MTEPSITCPVCGLTSHNPNDVREGYCGHCHDYTGASTGLLDAGMSEIMGRPMYYDEQGVPITMARWAWLCTRKHTAGYGRVGSDHVGHYWISTVWIGLDHNWLDFGPPIIFETMVFLDGTVEETGMHRYATREQALAGHEATVAEVRVLDQRAADQERINDGEKP